MKYHIVRYGVRSRTICTVTGMFHTSDIEHVLDSIEAVLISVLYDANTLKYRTVRYGVWSRTICTVTGMFHTSDIEHIVGSSETVHVTVA